MKGKLFRFTTHLFFVIASAILIFNFKSNPIQLHLALPESVKPAHISPPVSSGITLAGPPAPLAPEKVIAFVKELHIHGIPYEQARQFGPDVVPLLLDLLSDSQNAPYATNIVVTLGFMGYPDARQPLLNYLTQTEGEVSLDEFRGLTAVPFALAQLAHQGDTPSLEVLLQASDQNYWNSQTLRWTYNNQTYHELYQKSLLALGVSGQPGALARLEEIRGQAGLSAEANDDVLQQALELNQRVRHEGMGPVVNPDPNNAPPAEIQDTINAQVGVDDPNPDTHIHSFTVARHVNLTKLTTNSQVDSIFTKANEIIQTANSPVDVGCCVALQRSGSLGTFSVTDGTVGTSSELDAIASLSYHIKVVPALDYCGGYNPSILGCAWKNTKNMVVEYIGSKFPTLNSIVWTHEFGHNQSLNHVNDSTMIMNGGISFQNPGTQMTIQECTAWHSTSANPGITGGSCPLIALPPPPGDGRVYKYYIPLIYNNQ